MGLSNSRGLNFFIPLSNCRRSHLEENSHLSVLCMEVKALQRLLLLLCHPDEIQYVASLLRGSCLGLLFPRAAVAWAHLWLGDCALSSMLSILCRDRGTHQRLPAACSLSPPPPSRFWVAPHQSPSGAPRQLSLPFKPPSLPANLSCLGTSLGLKTPLKILTQVSNRLLNPH